MNDEVLYRVQENWNILDIVQQLRWIRHTLWHNPVNWDIIRGRMLDKAFSMLSYVFAALLFFSVL